ncbi:unnamed protein product, partial [Iphiclides podalirius]
MFDHVNQLVPLHASPFDGRRLPREPLCGSKVAMGRDSFMSIGTHFSSTSEDHVVGRRHSAAYISRCCG